MHKKDDSTIEPGSGAKAASGAPGIRPTWSPAAKSGVGCAVSALSHLWFTLGRGIVNEVYHPWLDHAAIRDLGLIVTGPGNFFSEEQKDCKYDIQMLGPGIPAYRLENHCLHGRYRIVKEIIADPHRDVLLQRIRFVPLQGALEDFRLHVLMSPRLDDQGKDNNGWVGAYRNRPMLFARRIAPSPGMRSILRRGQWQCTKQAHGLPTAEVVSPDALALVRFGLRAPDDPRILNTLKAIDAINRKETPAGPCWRRYNGDYYGEHDDGTIFASHEDRSGIGRSWPLLTGERGHYELAAGNADRAVRMLHAMAGFASEVGLLPEQVWDIDDVPEHDLYRGRASSSAMPLAWTHSEYIRLLRSIRDGKVFDRPDDAWERYVNNRSSTDLSLWRFDHQVDFFPAGRRLRLELTGPAIVHFSMDRWATALDLPTRDTGLGLHIIDLPMAAMKPGDDLIFTFRWTTDGDRWEGKDFRLTVDQASPAKPTVSSSARPQTQTQHQRSTQDDHSTASSSQAQRARPVRATSKN